MKRRTLLKAGLLQGGFMAVLQPLAVLAEYPIKAFSTREIPAALGEVLGIAEYLPSDKIEIVVPPIAADANVVPVKIRSMHENTESISIVVEQNPTPFTAYFRIYQPQNFVSTRIRMVQSSDLLVVVKADGVLHASRRRIRVGLGSCEA